MKFKGKIVDVSLDFLTHKPKVTLQLTSQEDILTEEFNRLNQEETLDITIVKHREKRSLNANNYAWSLITEIGNVLRANKEEVYLTMLKRYGQVSVISVLAEVNLGGYIKYYEHLGEGEVNGKKFKHYKIFKGSSEFDTKEMAIFIDGIVSECKELGIQTLEDIEIKRLIEEYGDKK